jgi:hypothetical protein
MLEEGWYLMNTSELEHELARWRSPDKHLPPSTAVRLSIEDALARRNAGNLPDETGRSLRLVLRVEAPSELSFLQAKRLVWEPDFHSAPGWRRAGSKPVNVIPLRVDASPPADAKPWWEDPSLAALEEEWATTGMVAGLTVPGEYRGFVYKTVLSLRAAGVAITPDAVADSIARWVPAAEADRIRAALTDAAS